MGIPLDDEQVEARCRVLELTTLLLDELDSGAVEDLAGARLKAHLRALSRRVEAELKTCSPPTHLRLVQSNDSR